MGQRLDKASNRRYFSGNDPRKQERQVRALARFTVDNERALVDKKYKAAKDLELTQLKAKLGV